MIISRAHSAHALLFCMDVLPWIFVFVRRYQKKNSATERGLERVQLLRVQYWHEIDKVENLVFVDETGSNLAMTRRYAVP